LQQLLGLSLGDGLLIPDVMLKDGGGLFLDDINIEYIKKSLDVPVAVVESSPWGILDGVESIADSPVEIIQL